MTKPFEIETGDTLDAWLIVQGLEGTEREELLHGYCQRLRDIGVPLLRLHIAQSAFHPKYGGMGFNWLRDSGVSHERYSFSETPVDRWLQSPLYHLLKSNEYELRERLDAGTPSGFPFLNELRAETGATDYFAAAVILEKLEPEKVIDPDISPEGLLISWATDSPEGFSEAHLQTLRDSLPLLSLAMKSASNRRMARDLLGVYLGDDAGDRVLSGELRRGSVQTIDAVICYFDLTGFTELAEKTEGALLIDMINDYFGVAVDVIHGQGGNVLKFMGDGLLAIFDQSDATEEADSAISAAVQLKNEIAHKNAQRYADNLPITGFTLALHAGEVHYGNIGAEERLDFTAIGPAVNLTARLSGMHRAVGQNVILSKRVFRAATPGLHDLVSLGRYMLRGVSEPQELFTIHEAAD